MVIIVPLAISHLQSGFYVRNNYYYDRADDKDLTYKFILSGYSLNMLIKIRLLTKISAFLYEENFARA